MKMHNEVMKYFFGIGILFLILIAGCSKPTPENGNGLLPPSPDDGLPEYGPGDYDFSIMHDGWKRNYMVHVPTNYNENLETPVVINIHGGGGSIKSALNDVGNEYSEKYGFIYVIPAGTRSKIISDRLLTWNAGKWLSDKGSLESCCGLASDNDVDDVGFFSKMIEEVKISFNVDEDRIYVTGISNGGMMSHRLGCELEDKIAAIAPVASPAVPMDCNPSKPVPVMYIHGTADPCTLYYGGDGGGCFGGVETHYMQPAEDIVNKWKNLNNCSDESETVYQKGEATCISYNNCGSISEVEFCTIQGGGHTFPSGAQYFPVTKVGPVSYDMSFDQIWEFFQKH